MDSGHYLELLKDASLPTLFVGEVSLVNKVCVKFAHFFTRTQMFKTFVKHKCNALTLRLTHAVRMKQSSHLGSEEAFK